MLPGGACSLRGASGWERYRLPGTRGPSKLGKSTSAPSATHLPCAVNSEIKPSIGWDNFSPGLRGSRAGLTLARHHPAEAAAPTYRWKRRPRRLKVGSGGGKDRSAADAGTEAQPGGGCPERPRDAGSARPPGSLSCAPRVQDDSASAGSVVAASRREGSAKLPVTPQTSFTSPFDCGLPQCASARG